MMKRSILSLVAFSAVATMSLAACSLRDRVIEVTALPATAQQLLQKEFSGKTISFVKAERDGFSLDYDVVFSDGMAVEFDSRGEWREVNARQTEVPAGLVPQPIAQYVKQHYPETTIRHIERHRKGVEVDLSNGLEIEFDKQYRVRDIDD